MPEMEVHWSARAAHDMGKMGDRRTAERVLGAVERFAATGNGHVCKLRGLENEYRLRVGNLRVRFTMADGAMQVLRVLPRGGAY